MHKNDWANKEFVKGTKVFLSVPYIFESSLAKGITVASDYFKSLSFAAWNDSSFLQQDPDPNDMTNWWRFGGIEYAFRTSGIIDVKLFVHSNPVSSGQTSVWTYVSLETNPDRDYIRFRPLNNGEVLLGSGSNRWKQVYAATATISTSDARYKTTPEMVPDNVLDAWGDVQFCQFQMIDSVKKKGSDGARIHNGLIAQNIDSIFKNYGLDASKYGLFCFDSWEEKPESVDKDGNVREPAEPAGDMYSLRYEEALCMEAAYQRRRADRTEARIKALEERLSLVESKLNIS